MSIDSTYHRILSPTVRSWISTEGINSTPVGILACQRDPLLRELSATVVSSNVASPPAPAAKGKNAKKAVVAPVIPPGTTILEVVLNDTVIFPEGGGQPSDVGVIRTSDGITWDVLQAKRHGGQAVHHVRINNIDEALLAFSPGAKVKVELDKDRRYDHMTLHTSQHLLSALLETRLNIPTLSWSLTSYPAPCYVDIPRGLTSEEVAAIQEEANRLVFEGRQVHVEVQELDLESRKPAEKLENGRSVGRGLPEDYTGGVHRVLFILPHTDTISRTSATATRLNFLAGPRLINHLTSTHLHLTAAAAKLTCGTPLVSERVAQMLDERKNGTRRIEDLESELARFIATDLSRDLEGVRAGVFTKHVHRTDDSGMALNLLAAISTSFSEITQSRETPFVIVLTSSPTVQMSTNTNIVFAFGSIDKLVMQVGNALKTKLGVKGGGKGLKWSGKLTAMWKSKDDAVVEDILSNVESE
ncbi:ThrRS/AlaRS common domain-containing protein [Mycena rebaudengoi]|nr:ThrRS/AlaRS common domain-containing protein [Mycena rebaudengoi]